MTTTTTACTPPAPAPARPRAGDVVIGGLAQARESVARAAGVNPTSLSNADLTAIAQDLAALTSQVQALSLAVLAETRDRGRAGPSGAEADVDPAAWWGRLTGDPAEVLRGGLWIARLLKTRYTHTRVALEEGRLRLSQAKAIVRAAERAPTALTAAQISAGEQALVLTATGEGRGGTARPMAADRLRAEARRVFAAMLPTPAEAEQAVGDDLADEERRAERECYLALNDRGDGTYRGTFVVPTLHGRLLQSVLERLTAPRRLSRDAAGAAALDESREVIGSSFGELMGSAFCELIEHLPTKGLDHGNAIGLLIRADLDRLRDGTGEGSLDTGHPVSARAVRRLACNAGHIPVVLGGRSLPLDLGRTRRLYTRAQSRVLAALHDTCGVAGCSRPFAWCELHHLVAWARGGRTDIANALPLCGYHHRRAHDPDYELVHHRGREVRLRKRR